MEFTIPKKHGKYYHLKVLEDQKPKQISFFKTMLVQLHPLNHQQGYALSLKLSPNDPIYSVLKELDQQVLEQMIQTNQNWFQNDLTETEIRDMFKPSLIQNEMIVYYSHLRPPHTHISDLHHWIQHHKYSLPISIKCTLKCDGLFVYPTYFQLRWTVVQMDEYEDIEIEIDTEERLSIETYWKLQVAQKLKELRHQIQLLYQKETLLNDCIQRMEQSVSMNKWELEIEQLRSFMDS